MSVSNDFLEENNIFLKTQSILESQKEKEKVSERLKQLETLLLFDLIQLSPRSKSRNTKSHRKKSNDKSVLINSAALTLCFICDRKEDIPDEIENGGSYLSLEDKTITYLKLKGAIPIIFDLSEIWDSVENVVNYTRENGINNVLFTTKNLQRYPLYYKGGTKKHLGFNNDSYNMIKELVTFHCGNDTFEYPTFNSIFADMNRINEKIKERNRLEKEMEEENLEEIAKQSGGNDENEEIEEETDDKVEEISEEDMWEEIFQTIGILPRDCPCKQYSKALYKRCVVDGKTLRGLRPKHAIACTKQIAPL